MSEAKAAVEIEVEIEPVEADEIEGTRERASTLLDRADELGFASWEMLDIAGLEDPRQ